MFENLKIIKETQLEAKKIVNDALKKVATINQGLLQKSIKVNEESYRVEITRAKKRSHDLLESSSISIDLDIKNILGTAEHLAKDIETNAQTNHEKAVNAIIQMIFYRGESK
ncbi:MAG: hypothetical protein KAR20_23505 [Candidatus Heimdallarchaeota archaeon]|nr:hypothetical protein [Candidatus Heimdallarchaeota archaeon]